MTPDLSIAFVDPPGNEDHLVEDDFPPCQRFVVEMGITASRQFATKIAECADKRVGLESVSEEEVTSTKIGLRIQRSLTIQQWKRSYRRLPQELKKSIQNIISTPRNADCLSKVREIRKSDIGVPEQLRPYFQS